MRYHFSFYEITTITVALVLLLPLLWSINAHSSIEASAITSQKMVNQSKANSTIDLFNSTNFQAVAGGNRISFSGSVTGSSSGSDKLSIDFGDGTNGTTIIHETKWGPISHTYDISTNQNISKKVVAKLISADPKCFGCVVAISKPLDLPLNPRHHTRIDVSLPDDIVSGTSITVMGKLYDVDVIPPAEIPGKEIKFSGAGARPSWGSVTTITGGFTFSDPTGVVHIDRCMACDPDPDSGGVTGNMFLACRWVRIYPSQYAATDLNFLYLTRKEHTTTLKLQKEMAHRQ